MNVPEQGGWHGAVLKPATLAAIAADIHDEITASAALVGEMWPTAVGAEFTPVPAMGYGRVDFAALWDGSGELLIEEIGLCDLDERIDSGTTVPADDGGAAGLEGMTRLTKAISLWRLFPGLVKPAAAEWDLTGGEEVQDELGYWRRTAVLLTFPGAAPDREPLDGDHGGCYQPHRTAEGYADCDGRPL